MASVEAWRHYAAAWMNPLHEQGGIEQRRDRA
jgi:hypothetical protein